MIEEAPKYENFLDQAIPILLNPKYQDAINRINQEYLYWDKVKYRTPEDLDSRNFWAAVKIFPPRRTDCICPIHFPAGADKLHAAVAPRI